MTLPLSGIKVLEFSEHGFVPSAAAVLADWGADVVKIERPEGDPMRQIIKNNLVPDVDGYDYLFQLVNRNKRGVAIDVTVPRGREVFERLVKWADVYITNQLPRVRRKLRTEPADLFALNPRLVFAKGHGQGQRGVDAESGGFDSVSFWSRGGVAHVLTGRDATEPVGQRPAQGDVPTGMFFAGGVCAAIVHAQRTGVGIVVDTSLLNGAVWTLGPDMAYASLAGQEAPPRAGSGPRSPLVATHRTADGRWMMLSMLDDDRYFAPTCRALGVPELVERFPDDATPAPRVGRAQHDVSRVRRRSHLAGPRAAAAPGGLHLLALRVAAGGGRRSRGRRQRLPDGPPRPPATAALGRPRPVRRRDSVDPPGGAVSGRAHARGPGRGGIRRRRHRRPCRRQGGHHR